MTEKEYRKRLQDLSGLRWNVIMRAVDAKVPKDKVDIQSEVESKLYDKLWAESEAHEKKHGFWPVSEPVEIEWGDPALEIYKDPV